MTEMQAKHFRVEIDEDNIASLWIDRADEKVNTFNQEVLIELHALLNQLALKKELKGLILRSAKSTGFIFGADIKQFTSLASAEEAAALIQKGQDVFNALADFPKPTVALIEGFALGGGMECILACDARVARDDENTRMGLPEVKLGILPGWGGTVRLPRLIGPLAAMDMILTGRLVTARSAAKMGIVDAAVPARCLDAAARDMILNPPERNPSMLSTLLSHRWLRPIVANQLRKKVKQKASPNHYPAPYRIIDNWENFGAKGNEAFKAEIEGISQLFFTEASKNLIRLFFLTERLKSLGKQSAFKAAHVHVIGAGVMGGDIASWCALQGLTVTLQDTNDDNIAKTLKRAHKLYTKKLKKPRPVQRIMDNLIPDPNGHGVAEADVIIEAIFENSEAKQALFKMVEANAKSTAILATNTSSIPLLKIASGLNEPHRLIGIHFFNPVSQMQLVEVVGDESQQQDQLRAAYAFVKQINKVPLPVKSSPGFLINRILMPYLMESVILLQEGVSPAVIDKAATDFGMPMGPIELADTVGLDICLAVAEELSKELGGEVPSLLKDKVTKGELGRKTDIGFYRYNKKGNPLKEGIAEDDRQPELAHRLVFRMLNEAAACLEEGVVSDPDLVDIGMILGTGFAPFTGGPMQYSRSLGQQELTACFQKLTYSPHQALEKILN